MAKFFGRVIDLNNLGGCTYCEPYAGGAGAALTLLFLEKVDHIIINDLDKSIFAFWKSVTNDTAAFVDKIFSTPVTIDQYHIQKDIYKNKDSNRLDLGFATFFLNRTNRSGILNGGPIGGWGQEGKWLVDARFNKPELIDRIRKVGLYRNRISIENMDGINLMRKVHKTIGRSIFYVDPPYFVQGSSLYYRYYKKNDHVALAEFLNGNKNMNWVLTYDNVPDIHALYQGHQKIEFDLVYHADARRVGRELMVISPNLNLE